MATTPPSEFAQAVSRRVRMFMAGDKVTGKQLAETLQVDKSTITRKLHGPGEFSLGELDTIAPLFNVQPAELTKVEGDR